MAVRTLYPSAERAIPYTPKPKPLPPPRLGAALNPMEVPNRQAAQMGGLFGFVWVVVFILLLIFGGWKVGQELAPDASAPPEQTTTVQEEAPADSEQTRQPSNTNGGLVCTITNPYAKDAVLPAACK